MSLGIYTGQDAAVRARQAMEHVIINRIIKSLLADGYLISVNNGGDEDEITRSGDYAAIAKVLAEADEDYLLLSRTTDKGRAEGGWVRLVYGNDGWDVVCDYTVNLDHVMEPIMQFVDRLGDSSPVHVMACMEEALSLSKASHGLCILNHDHDAGSRLECAGYAAATDTSRK